MSKRRLPQTDLLLRHMALHGHITQLEAISLYRIFNIKGRINDLRNQGWPIQTDMRTDATGKRYARYSLKFQSDRDWLAKYFANLEREAA